MTKRTNLTEKFDKMAWNKNKEDGSFTLINNQNQYDLFLMERHKERMGSNKKNVADKTMPPLEKANKMVENMKFKSNHAALVLKMEAEKITRKLEEKKNATDEENVNCTHKTKESRDDVNLMGWPELREA